MQNFKGIGGRLHNCVAAGKPPVGRLSPKFEICFVSFVGFVTKQQLNDSTTNN